MRQVDTPQKLYFSAALCLAVSAAVLFLLERKIAAGGSQQAIRAASFRFLEFFPILLAYSGIAIVIGMLQSSSAGPHALRAAVAAIFAAATPVYVLGSYWLVWNRSLVAGGATRLTGVVHVAGLAMLFGVMASGLGALIGRDASLPTQAATQALPSVRSTWSLRVYTAAGFGLILVVLTDMWFESLAAARIPWTGDLLYLRIFAHPVGLTLGSVAIVLGELQSYVSMRGPLRLALSLTCGGALAIVCASMYTATGRAWPVSQGRAALIGLGLFTLVLVGNLATIATRARTAAAP